MNIRWFGAVAIIVGCGGFGFRMAAIQRKQEKELRDLVTALDILSNELRYRLSPLPELCSMVAKSLSLPMRASGPLQSCPPRTPPRPAVIRPERHSPELC